MTNTIDTFNTQTTQFAQWIAKHAEPSILSSGQKQVLFDKTNLLGKAQTLAADSKAILLSELDNENAFDALVEQDLTTPSLTSPGTRAKVLSQNGKATELLTTLMLLSSELSLKDLSMQLVNLLASYESYRKTSEKLDKEVDKAVKNAEKAKDAAQAASDALEGLKDKLQGIQDKIRKQKEEMSKLDKESPEYAVAQQKLNELQLDAESVGKEVKIQEGALKDSLKVTEKALTEATKALESQNKLSDQNGSTQSASTSTNNRTNAARLSELIAYFMQLINKNSETDLKSQMTMFESLQKSVQSEMEKKAKEIEEQEKKAAELQKTMGCIGKIIGAIVTVVSVASAAFTGGASLALAGVGVALMAGDGVAEAATGQSLTDRIMAPFMEHVFLPLMGLIEKVLDKVLKYTPIGQLLDAIGEAVGVDITSITKTALAALVTIAVIIAVAYVAKSAVKTVTEKLFGKTVEEAIKALMPKVAGDVVKKVSKKIAETVGELVAKAGLKNQSTAARALKLEKLTNYVSYANKGAQVTSNVIVADFREQATKAMSSFKLSQTELESIRKVLESVISAFEHTQSTYRDLAKLISDSTRAESTTGKHILNNMRV